MAQNYSLEDDERHIEALIPYLKDPRYIRIGSRPLLIVYKSSHLPNAQATFALWRRKAFEAGLGEICLAHFESGGQGTALTPSTLGLDLSVEFMPDWRNLGGELYATPKARLAMNLGLLSKAYKRHRICDYRRMVDLAKQRIAPNYPLIRCVTPGFDSTPRRPRGATILVNNSPELFEDWLRFALNWSQENNTDDQQVVFINAWNEWGEGNHLEPDTRNGRAYLEATRRAIKVSEKE